MGQAPSSPAETSGRDSDSPPEFVDCESIGFGNVVVVSGVDVTGDLPGDCLAHIFQFLNAGDRKRCSLVCKRWLFIDGQNRHRLSLDARAEILPFLPCMFNRFDSVTKITLRCDRKSFSLSDEAFVMVSVRCSNLIRVKLRGCREITDLGMESFARNCKSLRKLSCCSCDFGAQGLNAILEHCKVLEELSVKRIRGINESAEPIQLRSSSSLRWICLKELVNGEVFESLVTSRNLKKLKIIRCLGNWDNVLLMIGVGNSSLTEIHLERLQVSDVGLYAVSKCVNLETLHILKTTECSNLGLARVAKRCKLLRKLHIDGGRRFRRIGDDGLMAVAKHCLNLQELVLIGVNATHKSLSAIASNCGKLERLALCGSGTIGDTEVACIAKKCVALRKFCIKGCPISDAGIKALALGCPKLVKLKVKKCREVTGEVMEWLRERRRTLVVSMDGDETNGMVMVNEDDQRGLEMVVEEPAAPVVVGGGRLAMFKTKLGLLAGKNLVASTFKRWSQSEATSST